ncbi:unnamed protein product [Amoebophrya sp. A120]|nr:unnamed protein product [Amoebophrya sp. A120]|eukprot:GSA120T00008084001.1
MTEVMRQESMPITPRDHGSGSFHGGPPPNMKGKGKQGKPPKRVRNVTGAEAAADMFGGAKSDICPFYAKIGACRHGTTCSRKHIKPERTRSLLLAHVFGETPETLAVSTDLGEWSEEVYCTAVDQVEEFYEETFFHMAKFGEIEDLLLVDNISEHMSGNCYVKYYTEDAATKALEAVNGKFYSGRQIKAEYSPCIDFREARCRAFNEANCPRGQNCNFLHVRHVPKALKRQCVMQMYADHPDYKKAREEAGRPITYKFLDKVDWDNDSDAREAFHKKWWAMYEERREQEKAGTPANGSGSPEDPETRNATEMNRNPSFFPNGSAVMEEVDEHGKKKKKRHKDHENGDDMNPKRLMLGDNANGEHDNEDETPTPKNVMRGPFDAFNPPKPGELTPSTVGGDGTPTPMSGQFHPGGVPPPGAPFGGPPPPGMFHHPMMPGMKGGPLPPGALPPPHMNPGMMMMMKGGGVPPPGVGGKPGAPPPPGFMMGGGPPPPPGMVPPPPHMMMKGGGGPPPPHLMMKGFPPPPGGPGGAAPPFGFAPPGAAGGPPHMMGGKPGMPPPGTIVHMKGGGPPPGTMLGKGSGQLPPVSNMMPLQELMDYGAAPPGAAPQGSPRVDSTAQLFPPPAPGSGPNTPQIPAGVPGAPAIMGGAPPQ